VGEEEFGEATACAGTGKDDDGVGEVDDTIGDGRVIEEVAGEEVKEWAIPAEEGS